MKVVVTGGTGFVGREIVRRLLAGGHTVRVLSRRTQPTQAGVERVRGSVFEFATLPSAFVGAQAVIHLVGIISEIGDQTYERVHTTGTANAIHAAAAAGIPRFLHMSALGTRPNAVARYHRSKWEAEEIVRRSRLRWTIFRPSLIYGPDDQFVNLFARISRWSPLLPVMGPGTHLLQPIAVEDVAQAFVGALTQTESIGQSFDLCGRERLTLKEILQTILEVTGRRRWLLKVPLPVARLQAMALEALVPTLIGQAPPLNRDQLQMLQEDNVGDPEPACRWFGLAPMRFREGIRRFLRPAE